MRGLIYVILFLGALKSNAQSDSAYWFRMEFNFPLCLGTGLIQSEGETNKASLFLDNGRALTGLFISPGIKIHMGRRINLNYSFHLQFSAVDAGKSLDEMILNNPQYYVQGERVSYGKRAASYNGFTFTQSRFGIGCSVAKWNKWYVQAYTGYIVGKTQIPYGSFSLKSYESNDFIEIDFKKASLPTEGYMVGCSLTSFDPIENQRYFGGLTIFLEYDRFHANGLAQIESSQTFGPEEIEEYQINRTFQNIKIGMIISLGFNSIRRKS
jgi:hypothetical protein